MDAVSPVEVAATKIMPQPWLRADRRSVAMHRIHHVPDIWIPRHACHNYTLRLEIGHDASRSGTCETMKTLGQNEGGHAGSGARLHTSAGR